MTFERVAPESVGIYSGAIMNMLDAIREDGAELHGFMLLRHGKVCAEGSAAPYRADVPHSMYSFSKSFTSTAIGFAVQEGLLSLTDRVTDLLPEYMPSYIGSNLAQLTLKDLLTMSCGHEDEIDGRAGSLEEFLKRFFEHPFKYIPGTHFMYNTAGTNVLSAILTKKTGRTVTEFLRPRLFEPLEMNNPVCMTMTGTRVEMGGAGFFVELEDMARFISFVANRGSWNGRQLLNSAWFDEASAAQIDNYQPGGTPDWSSGYGFQFWRCAPEGLFRADGAYGQYGIVMPEQDAVLVMQAATVSMQTLLDSIWTSLLPGIVDGVLPEDRPSAAVLKYRLSTLELGALRPVRNPGAEESIQGTAFLQVLPDPKESPSEKDSAGENPAEEGKAEEEADEGAAILGALSLWGGSPKFPPTEWIHFDFEGNELVLTVRESRGTASVVIGLDGHFRENVFGFTHIAGCGTWRSADILELELRDISLVAGVRYLMEFDETGMTLTMDPTLPEKDGIIVIPDRRHHRFLRVEGTTNTVSNHYWDS